MKNSTFFKIALLIILTGATIYAISPKYQIKDVAYRSHFLTDAPGQESGSAQEKELIRVNILTGKIEKFYSWSSSLSEKSRSDNKWVALADEPGRKTKSKTKEDHVSS